MDPVTLTTSRLMLRPWTAGDRETFFRLNSDPHTMRFFPAPLTREQSDQLGERIQASLETRGWGLWAVEEKNGAPFLGFVGLHPPKDLPFMPRAESGGQPTVEIGWRLHRDFWGHGFATEAAREAVRFAFEELKLPELVSFTSPKNLPSIAVMKRLGFSDTGEDFDHPAVPEGHELRRHVLFSLSAGDWAASKK